MKILELFPALIMFESFVASVIYLCFGEWNKAIYWISGAAITFSVINMR